MSRQWKVSSNTSLIFTIEKRFLFSVIDKWFDSGLFHHNSWEFILTAWCIHLMKPTPLYGATHFALMNCYDIFSTLWWFATTQLSYPGDTIFIMPVLISYFCLWEVCTRFNLHIFRSRCSCMCFWRLAIYGLDCLWFWDYLIVLWLAKFEKSYNIN